MAGYLELNKSAFPEGNADLIEESPRIYGDVNIWRPSFLYKAVPKPHVLDSPS
jgi:hypothetical protein